MAMRLSLIDAFTDVPFSGNPAAVCLLDGGASDRWRQSVARELGFSETAYLLPSAEGVFGLRWFTPTVEVDLCGHATLASAHFLWEEGLADGDAPIRFETKSGPLLARRSGMSIELDFPSEPARECPAPEGLLGALGARAAWVGRNRFDYLVLVAAEKDVRSLAPDFPALASACGENRGVMVTAVSDDPGFDFVSRYFAPAAGIDEDPVTGSAHCCLGPFWSERLAKRDLRAFQASTRGGRLTVRVGEQRVYLGGNAVTIFRGELAVTE
jgi:predicted PhzF superfamily epimerase YddE/YHI9